MSIEKVIKHFSWGLLPLVIGLLWLALSPVSLLAAVHPWP